MINVMDIQRNQLESMKFAASAKLPILAIAMHTNKVLCPKEEQKIANFVCWFLTFPAQSTMLKEFFPDRTQFNILNQDLSMYMPSSFYPVLPCIGC